MDHFVHHASLKPGKKVEDGLAIDYLVHLPYGDDISAFDIWEGEAVLRGLWQLGSEPVQMGRKRIGPGRVVVAVG
ncbi:hypothetical protein RIF29_18848 [Crotalaria pallida]|uniref:Uncharacterized protein n=1 Tax=Crotalaria pallida TaxID=3830 RepID=A0AAN9F0W5_CROPI